MRCRVIDVVLKTINIAACALAYSMYVRLENLYTQEDLYGSAAKAVSKSNMWSGDKVLALQALLPDAPDDYYESIIAIANASMWSCDKLSAIRQESDKFAYNA